MAQLTFASVAQRQLTMLQHLTESLLARALAGKREQLDDFFLAQEHLEHWLQYLSPLGLDQLEHPLDAPPPLAGMRPAPPLPHEEDVYDGHARTRTREGGESAMSQYEPVDTETQRPRVTFPPEPLWVDDLEREQEQEP